MIFMYDERDETIGTFRIFGNQTAVFVKGAARVSIDGTDVKMAKPFGFIGGFPHIEAGILCGIPGMTLKFGECLWGSKTENQLLYSG